MPTVKLAGVPLIPAGEHAFTLVSVNEVEGPNPFKKKPSDPDTRTRWAWKFMSEMVDPDMNFYEHTEWTGPDYGDPRANLTKLLPWVMPGVTKEQADHLDTDVLLGRKYKARVRHVKNQKGEDAAELVYLDYIEGSENPAPEPKPVANKKKDKDEIPF